MFMICMFCASSERPINSQQYAAFETPVQNQRAYITAAQTPAVS